MPEQTTPCGKKLRSSTFVRSLGFAGLCAVTLSGAMAIADPVGHPVLTHQAGGARSETPGPGPRGFSTVTPFRPPDPGVPIELPSTNNASNNSNHYAAPAPNPVSVPAPALHIQPASLTPAILNQPIIPSSAITPSDAITAGKSFGMRTSNAGLLQINPATLNPSATLQGGSVLQPPQAGPEMHALPAPAHQIPVTRLEQSSLKALPVGNSLIRPESDLNLETEYGTLRIAAKSTVLFSLTRHSISIYTLHDAAKGKVEIEAGAKHLRIDEGTQLTLTSDLRSPFADINPLSAIKHKELKTHLLKSGLVEFSGSFSISSAILSIELLRNDEAVQKAASSQQTTYGSF